jgi:hypothetical protein
MLTTHRLHALGALLAAAALPVVATAQARTGATGSTGRIAVTLAAPPAPAPVQSGRGFGDHRGPLHGGPGVIRRWGLSGAYPIVVGTPYQASAPAPVYVPYPVPYYYPVPATAPEPPKPPPRPYNPAMAHLTVVGGGHDGGGGVMRIERPSADSLRVTWLGAHRPIREARLFLADSTRKSLQSRTVTAGQPMALFTLAMQGGPAAFVGLKVVFADGSTRTTLVPF